MSELTWTCHICGRERPNTRISILTKPVVIDGMNCGEQNIRYCNDNQDCIERVKDFDFFRNKE